jgi:tRNA nucleotidyltransferase (CCA-adding enzyme)
MLDFIPKEIIDIYLKLQSKGFEAYFVGGCVRDIFLQKKTKDWDLATSAKPEEVLKVFPKGFCDNKFGTVGIPVKVKTPPAGGEQEIIEITTFRTEAGYKDRRHPDVIKWGKTIEEDLARRDFTINAIAVKFEKGKTIVIDPHSGQKDIDKKIIRAVGNPKERFKEDALRLMRAVRLATELSFAIDEKTWKAIVDDSNLISEISNERIRDELLKILASNYPSEGIVLFKNSGLMKHVLPELLQGVDVSQERPGRHHTTDVFTHNLLSLKFCPSKDPIVRLTALIHDIGKPKVATKDEKGFVIFHNHELEGTRLAYQICERLRFSKKDRQRVVNLIRWHMFTVDERITDAAVRRFIRKVGVENVKDMMDLRIGDRLGGGTQTAESWRLKLFKKRVEEQLSPKPFSIEDMVVDGNDVMKTLNIKPSQKVGEILQKLFEEVDEDLSKNTKEYLLKRVKEIS